MEEKSIFACDMDGSLYAKSVNEYIAREKGMIQTLADWEEKIKDPQIKGTDRTILEEQYSEVLIDLRKDLTMSDFENIVEKLHFLEDIPKTLEILHKNNFIVPILTTGPEIVAKILQKKFGFDWVYGSKLEFKNDVCTGKELHIAYDKGQKLLEFCTIYNDIPFTRRAGMGDSGSDLDMFKKVRKVIAINCHSSLLNIRQKLQQQDITYLNTKNFQDVLPILGI